MNCLQCGSKTRVVDSRLVEGVCRRRRACPVCGYRFTTKERVVVGEEAEVATRMERIRAMADVELARNINERATDCLCDIVCGEKGCRAKSGAECMEIVPAWLSNEAEKQGINFSALLQSALKEKLNVNSPADIAK